MGEYNSSVTRVWPVFDCLFHNDSTGTAWLPSLLKLGSRATEVDQQIIVSTGPLLPALARFERKLSGPLGKVLGLKRAAKLPRIRNAYEVDIPPSETFLRWLLNHPEQLTWPKEDLQFSTSTLGKRSRLLASEPAVRDEALKELATFGAAKSRRKWWAFEGFTSVDCWLETENLLLLIEGKRTDAISASTKWFPTRNQIVRILEGAQMRSNGRKNFAVLVCAESLIELPGEAWVGSLPHLSSTEIDKLKSHYLGSCTWSDIAQQLCSDLKLPEHIDEAIATCLAFRHQTEIVLD